MFNEKSEPDHETLTADALTPTPTTFKEAFDHVAGCQNWSQKTRTELKSTLRQIAWSVALARARQNGQYLDSNRKALDLSAIPFDVATINQALAGVGYALAGFREEKSFRNAKSALRRIGREMAMVAPKIVPQLSPDSPYTPLLVLADRRNNAAVRLFATRLWQQNKLPEEVTGADLVEHGVYLRTARIGVQVEIMLRRIARLWRHTAKNTPAWPQAPLRLPTRPQIISPQLAKYPLSLQQDIQAVQSWMQGAERAGPFGGHFARRPFRAATVKDRIACIRRMLGVLVQLGTEPAAITSLQILLVPATAQAILQALWDRGQERQAAMPEHHRNTNGSGATGQTSQSGQILLMLARHCFPQSPEVLKQLQRLAKAVRVPNQTQMSRKNRTRLEQFKDPAILQRMLALPHVLMQEAQALHQQGRTVQAAHLARTAIFFAIEIRIPLRIQNLRSCRLGHNLRFAGAQSQVVTLGFHENETKNWMEVEFYVGPRLCTLLNIYIRCFLPILAASSPDFKVKQWLFPAGEGLPGPLSANRVREIIIETVAKRVGAVFHPHLFRSLAVMLCLQHSPNALEQCRQLLGDKTLTVILKHYAPVQQHEAAAYLDRLVSTEEDRLSKLMVISKRKPRR